MTTKRITLFVFYCVLIVTMFIAGKKPKIDAAPMVSTLEQAAPYTRYPRFVDVACYEGIRFPVVEASKGGNTNSEMWFVFKTDDCKTTAPIQVTRFEAPELPVTTPETPETPITSLPPVVIVPPVVVVEPPVVVVPPVVVEPPVVDESPAGNPGNLKDVGNAGENPNGKGTMDNDNAGGNGNGEHGNQGENGNSNKKGG